MTRLLRKQPKPAPNKLPTAFYFARRLLLEREDKGKKTYGTTLQPYNGRSALQDALEEVADLFVYLTQLAVEEGIITSHLIPKNYGKSVSKRRAKRA
jgi:hypothetical protein